MTENFTSGVSNLDSNDQTARLERIQSAMQLWGEPMPATRLDTPEQDEGIQLVHERRGDRIARALATISQNLTTIEHYDPERESRLNQDNGYGKLPVVLMHAAFANHPYVTSRRPIANTSVFVHEEDPVEAFFLATRHWPLLKGREEEYVLKGLIEQGLETFERLQTSEGLTEEMIADMELTCAIGTDAYLKFYEGNIRLVAKQLPRYRKFNHVDISAITTAGLLSLAKSIQKFDAKKGFKFSTYAMGWIRQAMHREFVRIRRTIVLPFEMHDSLAELYKFDENHFKKHGQHATTADYLDAGFAMDVIIIAQNGEPASLDARVSIDSETERYDLIADTDTVESLVENTLANDELRALIENAHLEKRELTILSLLYNTHLPGADSLVDIATKHGLALDASGERFMRPLSIEEVATIMDLSRSRIQQLEKFALSQLRDSHNMQ